MTLESFLSVLFLFSMKLAQVTYDGNTHSLETKPIRSRTSTGKIHQTERNTGCFYDLVFRNSQNMIFKHFRVGSKLTTLATLNRD